MISLGTQIAYTHRAGLVRRRRELVGREWGDWFFPIKGNGDIPYTGGANHGYVLYVGPKIETRPITILGAGPEKQPPDDWNKSVGVWEEEGSGVVTGLVRKLLGKSHGSYGGGEDFEPGYLEQCGHVDLYTVRWELRGEKFIYVPVWAARPAVLA